MSKILVSQNVTISNPKLKAIADDIANQLKLAADKVILNNFAPQEFPIRIQRGKRSFESILSPVFKTLSDEKKNAAHDRAKARFNKSLNERRKDFGKFAEIDLHSSSSVRELSSNLSLPTQEITKAELIEEKNKLFNSAAPKKKYQFDLKVKNRLSDIVLPPSEQDKINKLLKDKHQAMGGDAGILGKCTGWIYTDGGSVICEHGVIYINNGKAFEVHGAILEKYHENDGFLGRPTTDELTTPDGKGRYNHFDNGSIYWHPDIGAHEIHGAILKKWKALGWEQSFLGYPITDESGTPDGIGRYNHFQNGSIYWTAKTGAWEVHGAIRDLWESLGWEQSELGYPVTDELPLQNNGRYSRFEKGEIHWYPYQGAFKAAFSPFNTLTLRCVRLHCIKEEKFKYEPSSSDEIRMAGTLFEVNAINPNDNGIGYSFGEVNLEDDWDSGDWNCWSTPPSLISVPINTNNNWPKTFIATCVLIESDSGGSADKIKKLLGELQPYIRAYVQIEVAKAIAGAGAASGNPEIAALAPIAAVIAGYLIDRLFEFITEWFNDDLFYPVSCFLDLPDAQALFGNGTIESDDIYCLVWGYGAKYEFWLDWVLS